MTRLRSALVATLALATAGTASARGGRKPPPAASAPDAKPTACDQTTLPLSQGNIWTYHLVDAAPATPAPTTPPPTTPGATDKKEPPKQPTMLTLKVVSIAPGKDAQGNADTEIAVEESYGDRKIDTTWRCNAKGLTIAPDSFFFVGEPGSGRDMTLTETSRDSVSLLPDTDMAQEQAWVETVKVDIDRADKSGDGAVHPKAHAVLSRHLHAHPSQGITIENLGYFTPTQIDFQFRGNIVVDDTVNEDLAKSDVCRANTTQADCEKNADKACVWNPAPTATGCMVSVPIPIKRDGVIYLQKGVGILRIDDAFAKSWELVSTSVPLKH